MTSVEAKLRVGKIQKYKERRFSDRRVCLFLLINNCHWRHLRFQQDNLFVTYNVERSKLCCIFTTKPWNFKSVWRTFGVLKSVEIVRATFYLGYSNKIKSVDFTDNIPLYSSDSNIT